ncbi:MAG: sodium:alanine symporter family protein [Ruminococcaceae bacterium]|nr:sodium:alanine symporter family protein [Oscillospiraceae bacterium]
MEEITNILLHTIQRINAYLSDYILIILLIGTGLFYTFETKFIQIRCFHEGIKKVFIKPNIKKKENKGLTSFQSLMTSIAAQVGTGNIIGACGAILLGGPGAIFWMWVIAFFGMATIYAEAVLAQETREILKDGTILGGPVYYIKKAFNNNFGKFLAGFFSVSLILALGFMGTMVQSNSIAETSSAAFNIPAWLIGLLVAATAAFIFIGGINRVTSVTEKLVPLMAILYLLLGIIVLIFNFKDIPEAVGMIFKYAFQPQAIIGGSFSYALKESVSQGVKRGLFSNEAGMGSTPHAHALANVSQPHDQGVVAMIGAFIDTFVVLTMTALVAIVTLYAGNGPLADGVIDEGISKSNMITIAFSEIFGDTMGSIFVAICLLFFAFSSIIGWNVFVKINVQYLFGKKAIPTYSTLTVLFIFVGSLFPNDLVWELADMFNNFMVIPNIMALIALSGIVINAANTGKK